MDRASLNKWKIIDLKNHEKYIPQYVDLRNSYIDLLLTYSVTIDETKEWLTKEDVEIRCIIDRDILIGVVILYLKKHGEIAFFAKRQSKGIGSKLLYTIEKVAKEKNLNCAWAWVLKDNLIAQRVFEKNGFVKEGINEREYKGLIRHGIKYKKDLIHDPKR